MLTKIGTVIIKGPLGKLKNSSKDDGNEALKYSKVSFTFKAVRKLGCQSFYYLLCFSFN